MYELEKKETWELLTFVAGGYLSDPLRVSTDEVPGVWGVVTRYGDAIALSTRPAIARRTHVRTTTSCMHQRTTHNTRYFTETHLRATERHLPYAITQCYVPPDTGERSPP